MFYVRCLRNAFPITRTAFASEAEARVFATTLADTFATEAWREGIQFFVDMDNLEAIEEAAAIVRNAYTREA